MEFLSDEGPGDFSFLGEENQDSESVADVSATSSLDFVLMLHFIVGSFLEAKNPYPPKPFL